MTKEIRPKNYLGIDYGQKVVGLAIYAQGRDPFVLLYGKIIVENEAQVIRELERIADEEAIDCLVLGLPLYTDGKESDMTKIVRDFGARLEKALPQLEVYLQDETLTSFEAQERMKNSPKFNFKVDPKQIDAVAASIILEDFLGLR